MHLHWSLIWPHLVTAVVAAAGAVWAHRQQVAKVLTIVQRMKPPRDQMPVLRWAGRWVGSAAIPALQVLLQSGNSMEVGPLIVTNTESNPVPVGEGEKP